MLSINYEDVAQVDILDPNGLVLFSTTRHFYFILADETKPSDTDRIVFKKLSLPMFEKDSTANLRFTMEDGTVLKIVGRNEVSTSGKLVVCDFYEQEPHIDRRRYYKIQTHERCIIPGITHGMDLQELKPAIIGVIRDINLGGIFFEAEDTRLFEEHDVISVQAELGEGSIDVLAKILRVKPADAPGCMGYACCFLAPGRETEEVIGTYINQQQVIQRAMERENIERERLELEEIVRAHKEAEKNSLTAGNNGM
jgi:hypothetical protein